MTIKRETESFMQSQERYLNGFFGDVNFNFRGIEETIHTPYTGFLGEVISGVGLYRPFVGRLSDFDPHGDHSLAPTDACVCCGNDIETDGAVITTDEDVEIELALCKKCACSLIPWVERIANVYNEY